MVTRKNMKRNALISVYDKSEIKKICDVFDRFNIGIISTGATAKKIISLGYKCKEISNLTKFKEILDGRVKTLSPKLHASILYKRNNTEHVKTFKKLNFPIIDFVIVNFYPFVKISNKEIPPDLIKQLVHGANEEDIIASGLEDTMRVAFQDMLEIKDKYNLETYRMSAYAIALKKIEKSYLELGI